MITFPYTIDEDSCDAANRTTLAWELDHCDGYTEASPMYESAKFDPEKCVCGDAATSSAECGEIAERLLAKLERSVCIDEDYKAELDRESALVSIEFDYLVICEALFTTTVNKLKTIDDVAAALIDLCKQIDDADITGEQFACVGATSQPVTLGDLIVQANAWGYDADQPCGRLRFKVAEATAKIFKQGNASPGHGEAYDALVALAAKGPDDQD